MLRLRLVNLYVAALMVACTILLFLAGAAAQETKGGDIILPQIGSGSVDAYIEALKSDIRAHTRKIIEVNKENVQGSARKDGAPVCPNRQADRSTGDFEDHVGYASRPERDTLSGSRSRNT